MTSFLCNDLLYIYFAYGSDAKWPRVDINHVQGYICPLGVSTVGKETTGIISHRSSRYDVPEAIKLLRNNAFIAPVLL
jgi:hypothetical protein